VKICQRCSSRFSSPLWQCDQCGWTAGLERTIRLLQSGGDDGAPGFQNDFFEHVAEVESEHFWFTSRNALLVWAVRRFFPDARTLLDVGCGTGQVVAALQGALPRIRFTATDAFISGLRIAAGRAPGVELLHADATSPLYEAEFDVVGAFDVLEHIEDDEAAVRALARAVKPGGGILITVPQHEFLWSSVDEFARHRRRYSRARLTSLLERAGLTVVKQTSFVSLLLPAMIATRTLQRGGARDPHAEFRLPAVMNLAGRGVMAAERALIRAGWSLPAGGSLLTVAHLPA
jgi:SAM-dependent methyltransferase